MKREASNERGKSDFTIFRKGPVANTPLHGDPLMAT